MNYFVSYEEQRGKDRLDVRVNFNDGKSYFVSFVSTDYIKKEMKKNGCVAVPALIPIDDVSMDRIKELIGYIVATNFFDALKPIEEGQ